MKCEICGEEMTAIMLDVGFAKWFCFDCEEKRIIGSEVSA